MNVKIQKNALERWFLVHAGAPHLAWSGSRWVDHFEGMGLVVQVSNFDSLGAAGAEAERNGFIVEGESETMNKEKIDALSRALADQGKLIEAGFVSLRYTVMHPEARPEQIAEMRTAFFAGAQHLFGSIMSILEPGAEPTENDLSRMTLIQTELDSFIEQFRREHHV